ncbi:hypothetical protein SLS62_003056 [Diatrype stigma]|uniref:Enoyl reductase (ER) domain-containing protein n=1 Tax=Diatrype stigma TaxID=117547 RepID=A0AAN9UXD9_9PEZI
MAAATAAAEKTTMRAWLYSTVRNGIENSLELNETTAARPPWPPAKNNSQQVLVKVHFASLNPVDYKLAELGLMARAMISVPASPGLDFSGVVAAVAAGAEEGDYKVGDRVFGRLDPTRFGALGEYVVADREGLAKIPSSSLEEQQQLQAYSCIGTAGLTAYQCIAPNVTPGRGDRVFINGGSGGTGTFGIQIAKKALGCYVVASCSTANVELCRRLGADFVIDYKTQDVTAVLRELASAPPGGDGSSSGGKFKLVVDNVGLSPADLYTAADDFLDAATGKFVQVAGGFTLTDAKAMLSRSLLPGFLGGGRRSFSYLMVKNRRADLERLGAWVAEGKIEAVIDGDGADDGDKVFDNAVVAFRKLKTGRVKGKVVVRVAKEAAVGAE